MKTVIFCMVALFLFQSCTKTRKNYVETTADINMEMIYVDGGKFMMGVTEEQGAMTKADEYPVCEED